MKKSQIVFNIELDENNVPDKISWNATDKPTDAFEQTNAIALSLWDQFNKNTMRIDLWTNEMPVDEMKRFAIDTIGGLAQTILTSTGDEKMANEMNALCDKLVRHVEEELKKQAEEERKKQK
jgi:gliding motility-associated protein GldC